MFNIIFADGWIWTVDLWNLKHNWATTTDLHMGFFRNSFYLFTLKFGKLNFKRNSKTEEETLILSFLFNSKGLLNLATPLPNYLNEASLD